MSGGDWWVEGVRKRLESLLVSNARCARIALCLEATAGRGLGVEEPCALAGWRRQTSVIAWITHSWALFHPREEEEPECEEDKGGMPVAMRPQDRNDRT